MSEKFKDKYRIPSNRLRGWDYANNGYYYITIVTADRKRLFGNIVNGEMVLNDLGQIVYDEFFKSFELRTELFLGEFVLMPDHLHAIVILDKTDCECCGDGHEIVETNNDDGMNGHVETGENIGMHDRVDSDDCVGMGDCIDMVNHVDVGNCVDMVDHVDMVVHVETDGRPSLRPDNPIRPTNPIRPNIPTHPNNPIRANGPTHPNNPIRPVFQQQPTPPKFQRQPKSISSFVAGFKSSTINRIDDWIDANNIDMEKFNKNNPLWQSNYHDHIIRNETEYRHIAKYIRRNPVEWKEETSYERL